MQFSVSDDLGKWIIEQASQRGYASPELYLRELIGAQLAQDDSVPLSDEEFDDALAVLSSDREIPTLPADFSRADIYCDHD